MIPDFSASWVDSTPSNQMAGCIIRLGGVVFIQKNCGLLPFQCSLWSVHTRTHPHTHIWENDIIGRDGNSESLLICWTFSCTCIASVLSLSLSHHDSWLILKWHPQKSSCQHWYIFGSTFIHFKKKKNPMHNGNTKAQVKIKHEATLTKLQKEKKKKDMSEKRITA